MLAHRIGHEGACAQSRDIPRLRALANSLVNRKRVPAALQEPFLSAVAALEEKTPVCVPAVPAAAPTPVVVPAAPPPPRRHAKHDHGHHKHGKHDH